MNPEAVASIPPGHSIRPEPGYDYVREIASGGYGFVSLFTRTPPEPGLVEFVAGKFIYRETFGSPDEAESDAAYHRAVAGLQNFRSLSGRSDDLLHVFDVRQRHEDGYFCYMMELADDLETGRQIDPARYRPRTLKNELRASGMRRRLPARRCVEVAIGLTRGLGVLHDSGFIHRDVRPSNIIFVKDVPKLADIDLLTGERVAATSYIPGPYAAPEDTHSGQADIFSLGKTLYEMMTGLTAGEFPCLPPDIRHWEDHRTVLELNRTIGKACARDLRERYATADAMLGDLERVWYRQP